MNVRNIRIKRVMRWDDTIRTLRLCRVMWERGTVGDGQGYSSKLSFALTPKLFRWEREWAGWIVTILGIRIHHKRSYGGIFA